MSSIVCVDAGIVIKQVASSEDRTIHQLWEAWFEEGRRIIAPGLMLFEVSNVLYRLQKHAGLDGPAVDAALTSALALPIRIASDPGLHREALDAARRFDLPAADDAHYVALAEREGAVLWTADQRLARKLQERGATFVRCPT